MIKREREEEEGALVGCWRWPVAGKAAAMDVAQPQAVTAGWR